jgi:hypothetical protein
MSDEPIGCVYRFERDEDVTVEYRGDGRWAVCSGRSCLNTDGDFEYEAMPSNRTDDFFVRCRFSFDEAVRLAQGKLGWRQRVYDEARREQAAGDEGHRPLRSEAKSATGITHPQEPYSPEPPKET